MVKPSEEDMIFGLTMHNIRFLRQILKALTIVDDVIVEVGKNGMRLTVEDGLCFQASVLIPQEFFAEFFLKENDENVTQTSITFVLNLHSLTNCLRMILNDECTLIIIYSGEAFPLFLAFNSTADSNIAIEAELKTKIFHGTLNYHKHTTSNECNTIVMKGIHTATLFSEIDCSSDEIEIVMSPQEPFFLLGARGRVMAEATVQVAKTSKTIMQFNCQHNLKEHYRTSHIRFASKCLILAHTVSLTIYNNGLLCIELLMANSTNDNTTKRPGVTSHSNLFDEPKANLKYFITPLVDRND